MSHPKLEALVEQIKANSDPEVSAGMLIAGLINRMQAAVDAAIANGASTEELEPVTDEIAAAEAASDDLAAAVVENT